MGKLKAWNFAFRHAENTIALWKKHKMDASQSASAQSSECTFLAHLYAAEALIHLNKFNAAIQHLNPANFPHLNIGQYASEKQNNSPKSAKSERGIDAETASEKITQKQSNS